MKNELLLICVARIKGCKKGAAGTIVRCWSSPTGNGHRTWYPLKNTLDVLKYERYD